MMVGGQLCHVMVIDGQWCTDPYYWTTAFVVRSTGSVRCVDAQQRFGLASQSVVNVGGQRGTQPPLGSAVSGLAGVRGGVPILTNQQWFLIRSMHSKPIKV